MPDLSSLMNMGGGNKGGGGGGIPLMNYGGAISAATSGIADALDQMSANQAADAAKAKAESDARQQAMIAEANVKSQHAQALAMAKQRPSAATISKLSLARKKLANVQAQTKAFNAAHPESALPMPGAKPVQQQGAGVQAQHAEHEKKPMVSTTMLMVGGGVVVAGALGFLAYRKWGRK